MLEMFFDELRVYCSRVATALQESDLQSKYETNSTFHDSAANSRSVSKDMATATRTTKQKVSHTGIIGSLQATAHAAQNVVVESTGQGKGTVELLATSMRDASQSMTTYEMLESVDDFRLPNSCYSHQSQIRARLSFLKFTLESSASIKLEPEHALALWECLVTHAVSRKSRDLVFEWFYKILDPWFVEHRKKDSHVAAVPTSSNDANPVSFRA